MNELDVQSLIRYFFPKGTRGTSSEINLHPVWPPDLFGITAHIALITDCYTELLNFRSSSSVGSALYSEQKSIEDTGKSLADYVEIDACPIEVIELLQTSWKELLKGDRENAETWKISILRLLIIADVACESIGFYDTRQKLAADPENEYKIKSWIPQVYAWMANPDFYSKVVELAESGKTDWFWDFQEYVSSIDTEVQTEKLSAPSACILLDYRKMCVLPKGLTPSVGCTIRSLTVNLSLHPGYDQVRSNWFNNRFDSQFNEKELNVLIVPYPFTVNRSDFHPGKTHIDTVHTFSITPNWLHRQPDIVQLIEALFSTAKAEGREVDVVILPELAVDHETYSALAGMMAAHSERFMMLIAGVSYMDKSDNHINASYTAYIEGGEIQGYNIQNKHHRWKLDKGQIKTYSLSAQLKPDHDWWESTHVVGRTVDYHVFQKGACFATLICEDLARQDPCKPSIQSVGPNLIFALLMDSPQFKNRWPGRYTTGLTEDPGASVLTLSSLGLVERSNFYHNSTRRTIALWGDQNGIREIDLPIDHHGVLLVLANVEKELYTLDNRKSFGQFWELETLLPLKGQIS